MSYGEIALSILTLDLFQVDNIIFRYVYWRYCMFSRLLKAYKDQGFLVHCGNNHCPCAALATLNGETLGNGGGIAITDIAFFVGLSKIFTPNRILIIGNAFGYSAFCLAEVFPGIHIDTMDAEIEGDFNRSGNGSQLTRDISSRYYGNQVEVKVGLCPEDLIKCLENNKYDLIFLDGHHTNEQQLKDLNGLASVAANTCIMYLHDVETHRIIESYDTFNNTNGFHGYSVDFSCFGCKALVRSNQEVENWLSLIHESPYKEHRDYWLSK